MPTILVLIVFVLVAGALCWLALTLFLALLPYLVIVVIGWLIWEHRRDIAKLFVRK